MGKPIKVQDFILGVLPALGGFTKVDRFDRKPNEGALTTGVVLGKWKLPIWS